MPPSEKFSVQRVAELARLEVPDYKVDQVQDDLNKILDFIQVLDELQSDNVEPFFGLTSGSLDSAIQSAPIRPDETRASTPRDEILKNSPKQDGEYYCVPPVFD